MFLPSQKEKHKNLVSCKAAGWTADYLTWQTPAQSPSWTLFWLTVNQRVSVRKEDVVKMYLLRYKLHVDVHMLKKWRGYLQCDVCECPHMDNCGHFYELIMFELAINFY